MKRKCEQKSRHGRGTGARHLTKVLDKGEDLYYRLCADMIHTPTLREQIADRPDDLQYLAEFFARRVLTDPCRAAT